MIELTTMLDVTAILLAMAVAYKIKTSEAILLVAFFATASYISYFIFASELFFLWPMVFTVLIVLFGLLSYNHIVIVGYIAQLGIVGLNQLFAVDGYSAYIYGIFAFQLLAVTYGHHFEYYRDMFSHSPSGRGNKIKTP